ncbi:cyclopropane-fatty-acyl-phospholipid synthase [Thraustotheca clavata]|uniref:Cyclopropane-fatty-acyl-phospholipid synthase n=1 Tax=Thraustotheca clavata TaxID=74557 RepID=A0A1V9ZQL6_9STRA|nr:cyclopropane-fatty-acyl-phospholipid synthase [Thraustotheca clavata]
MSNQKSALMAAGVLGGIAVGSLLVRTAMYPIMTRRAERFIVEMLKEADILVGRDIVIHNRDIYLDWTNRGMLAIGESYMNKDWESLIPLDQLLTKLMLLPSDKKRALFKSWDAKFVALAGRVFNYQSPSRAGIVGAHHYDIGNDFYKLWLDPNMQYSCAYFKDLEDSELDKAQENKLHLIAKKLKLEKGMTVLEIGCGWGGLGIFFAKHYGVHVTGITISNEQLKGAREQAEREGVSDLTQYTYCDYRKMTGEFDRVVSIAMLEAVGYKNMDEYYSVINRCLKKGGLALVHSITSNRSTKTAHQLWILKYIFPNGFIPSITQMCQFAEKKLVVEDVHNIGPDYDKTLMVWNARFQEHIKSGNIQKSPVFVRMWEYYLQYCAAGFRARTIQLHQVVYSKHRPGRYEAVR